MFGQNRAQVRQYFNRSWQKHLAQEPLEPLENIIVSVLRQHPEYHELVTSIESADRDYNPEDGQANPFLHMGMHITLAEQLASDRPAGIRELHNRITSAKGDPHSAEHQMMECLGLILWEAQSQNRMPDEAAYLQCLKKLARG